LDTISISFEEVLMAQTNGRVGWFRVELPGKRPTSWHFSHGEVAALNSSSLPGHRTVFTPKAVCGYTVTNAAAQVTWREVGRDSSKPICGRCLKGD
jgi:hypothetical protein